MGREQGRTFAEAGGDALLGEHVEYGLGAARMAVRREHGGERGIVRAALDLARIAERDEARG